MIVRDANRDDGDAIAALHAASWQATYRDILSREYLDDHVCEDRKDLWAARFAKFDGDKHHVAVAEEDRAPEADERDRDRRPILGFVCVLLDEEPELGALLDNLHVAPDRHRQGVGRRLMADAAHWVAARRPDWSMHLWVYEKNARTVAFYRSIDGREEDHRTIVTPAGNRAVVLRFEWSEPLALAHRLDATFA